MSASHFLVTGVGIVYAGIAIAQLYKRDFGGFFMYLGYATANIGAYKLLP